MVIDAHVHFGDGGELENATAEDIARASRRLLRLMDAERVSAAVLVARHPADDPVARAAADQPDRFAAIGAIDLAAADPVQRSGDWLDAGARGVRVRTLMRDGRALPLVTDVLSLLEERQAVLWAYPLCEEWELLTREIAATPTLRVFVNHSGFCQQCRPGSLDRIRSLLESHQPASVMFSGWHAYSKAPYPYEDLHGWARALYRQVGASRLAWASDYPWSLRSLSYAENLGFVQHALPDLTADEHAQIMGRTIADLLGRADWARRGRLTS